MFRRQGYRGLGVRQDSLHQSPRDLRGRHQGLHIGQIFLWDGVLQRLDGHRSVGVRQPNQTALRHRLDGLLVDPVGQHQLFIDGAVRVKNDDHVLSQIRGLLLHLHGLLQSWILFPWSDLEWRLAHLNPHDVWIVIWHELISRDWLQYVGGSLVRILKLCVMWDHNEFILIRILYFATSYPQFSWPSLLFIPGRTNIELHEI